MTWIWLTIILGGIAIGGLVFNRSVRKANIARDAVHAERKAASDARRAPRAADPTSRRYYEDDDEVRHPGYRYSPGKWIALGATGLWLALTLFAFMLHPVASGEVGVVRQFGVIVGQRSSGIVLTLPWQSLDTENIKTQKYEFHNRGEGHNDQITGFSSDTQDVFIDGTLNFNLAEKDVQHLLKTVGTNWFDVIVKSRVFNFAKEETVKYTSIEQAPHREDIRQAIQARLTTELAPFSINVVSFLIDNLDFDQAFKDSITAKQVAAQNAIKAQNDATAAVNTAEGAKQAAIKAAEGEAAATKVKADAQAQANAEIAASITPALIEYQKALALTGWNPSVIGDASVIVDTTTATTTPG